MLLGDADVEDPVGVGGGEAVQADGDEHGGGEGDDVRALAPDRHHLLVELVGPDAAGDLERQPGLRVELADAVELVGLVVDGRLVAAALLGDDVDDDRPTERPWPCAAPARPPARRGRRPGRGTSGPRSSNMPCGATMSLMPFLTPCSVSYIAPPTTGVRCERLACPSRGTARSRGSCAASRGGRRGRRWSGRRSARCR